VNYCEGTLRCSASSDLEDWWEWSFSDFTGKKSTTIFNFKGKKQNDNLNKDMSITAEGI